MIEVVFSDSTKGAMKIKRFEGYTVGGNTQDVVNIGFALDIGDISGEIDGIERQKVLKKMWERFGVDDNETEQFFQTQREDMQQLLVAASSGIPIRIWTSDAPYSACGFHFICHLLREINCELSVIYLPKYWQTSEKEFVSYNNWGDVEPGKFYQFIPLEKPITLLEKRMFSNRWCDLMLENAPLRATVNGKLLSIPENFYDHIIIQNIPNDEFCMAKLIGTLLGKYQLGISDSWIALRVDKMIQEQKLIVVEDKDKSHPYKKILKKTFV